VSRRVLLVAVAAALAVPDLVLKAVAGQYAHPRGAPYVAVAAVLLAAVVALVPRVPSRGLAVAGGVAAAGVAANLASVFAWSAGVPNPLVVGDVAFNVADLEAVVGACALVAGAAVFALRHPELLHEPL
jgi:hypothetical protein